MEKRHEYEHMHDNVQNDYGDYYDSPSTKMKEIHKVQNLK